MLSCLDCYSLSVLRRTHSSYQDCVKHYRISHLQNGWVYISPGLTFPSLHHLVEHYSGLCWGCHAGFCFYFFFFFFFFPPTNMSDNSKRLTVKRYLLSQILQMDCAPGWQSRASSRVPATQEMPGLYPQPSGGLLSTGRTLAGGAGSL